MRKRTIAVVFALIAAVTSVFLSLPATAGAATASRPGFVAQAEAAGLSPATATALQAKIDHYLTTLHGRGTQVSPNQIDLHGAVLNVAVPGESQPRQLVPTVTSSDACTPGADYGWFCAYSGENFTGDNIGMYDCGNYGIPWSSTGSWNNNQTTGTRPWLYWEDSSIAPWHMPAAWSDQTTGVDWWPVSSITNC